MKILFFLTEPLVDSSGVSRKILTQVDALRNLGNEVHLTSLELKNGIYVSRLLDNNVLEQFKCKIDFIQRQLWRFRFNKTLEYIIENKIDLLYIRYNHKVNPFYIRFLKKVRKADTLIIMEVPTYPYDGEYIGNRTNNFTAKFWEIIEKKYRMKFQKFVFRVITFSTAKSIFGISTINIGNGVNLFENSLVFQNTTKQSIIRLIGVANIEFWHGYDRLILGIYNYYNEKSDSDPDVIFEIVGDTKKPETQKYIDLVSEKKLNKYVKFYGVKFGNELGELFKNSDLGIGCLGCHRKDITFIKSIKNREYCARGIPFIYSETDLDFENQPFIMKAPADETPVNVFSIVKFLQQNEFDSQEIRNFAVKNLSWESQLEKVMNEVKTFFHD